MSKTIEELISPEDRAKLEALKDLEINDSSQEEYLEFINQTLPENEEDFIDPYFSTHH